MNRLYHGGFIGGPAFINVNGGTIENPIQPNSYGRHFSGGTIDDPSVSSPDVYEDLPLIMTTPSFIAKTDNDPKLIPGVSSFISPQFLDIRYNKETFARATCQYVWNNKTSQRNTFVNSIPIEGNPKPVFTRRHDHSAPNIDMSCISPWNERGGRRRCGTLINPTHTIHANHSNYFPLNGQKIVFVSMDNVEHERTVIDSIRIGTTDLRVCRLDEPLPSSIPPALVPPANFFEYLNYTLDKPDWDPNGDGPVWAPVYPIYRIDQHRRIGIRLFAAAPSTAQQIDLRTVWMTAPFWGNIIPVDPEPVSGDSGCPTFWPFKGRVLVLMLMWSGQGSEDWTIWSGSSPSSSLSQVQDYAGPIEIADLSEFTNYYA